MFLSLNKLLTTENDREFYRLFFAAICFINIVSHFLCLHYAPQSFDPLTVRTCCSVLCFITFIVSFFDEGTVYKNIGYLTLFSFISVNNCYLLGNNNFSGEYFLGSLINLLLVSFLCKRFYELAALIVFNLLCFAGAFYLTIVPIDELMVMVVTVLVFSGVTCLFFLLRRSYIVKYLYAKADLRQQIEITDKTNQQLVDTANNLHYLQSANKNLVIAFDSDKVCTGVWFPADDSLFAIAYELVGRQITDLNITNLDYAVKNVLRTHQPTDFDFKSLFNNESWYKATITPVVIDALHFTGSYILTIEDTSFTRNLAEALRENELVLHNEQIIAKMGSWWMGIANKETYWSNNLFSILEASQIPPERTKLGYYLSLVHPDDRDDTHRYFANAVNNPLAEFEHRLITPKGNLKYLKVVSGLPVKDDDGNVVKIAGVVMDITDSKLATHSIKKSQSELLEVQTIAKIGSWRWDIELNNLRWSDEIYNIYDLIRDDVKHEDHFKMLLSFVHPDDRAQVAAVFKDHLKIPQPFIEYRIITKSGKLKYLSLIIGKSVKSDGTVKNVIGTLQDNTDRKRLELNYERGENKYKSVLETISLAAVTLNRAGDIAFCNKHLADIVGYDKDELLGMNWIDNFVPGSSKAQFIAWLEGDTFHPQHTSSIRCKNGQQRIISWKNTVTHDELGRIVETTSIGEDITDIKKARESLILAKESAEKSSRFKSDFLSIMSHEIRTPMNAVIGNTNLLLQDNPAPRQLEYLNNLRFSSNNLLELINDILDYNKIEAGKLELYKTPFNIHKLAQNILQSFKNKADDNGTELVLHIDKIIPAHLIGDQLRLGQVLNNLLSNAVKFTQHGKVTLKLQSVQDKFDKIGIRFLVTDTGIGISQENIEKIFDPFTQEYHSTQSDYGGTGLGLAITKRLVELHNSTIKLVSTIGLGTEFSFDILFEKASVVESEPETEVFKKIINPLTHVKGMKILLVDDNKMNLLIATKFIKNWDAEVTQATNGQVAVDMALQNNFDLIIMDLQMPIMDGFTAASIIKQNLPEIPIIALSADAMPETRLKAEQHGMDDYLTKPFVPEGLFEKIAKYYKPYAVNN